VDLSSDRVLMMMTGCGPVVWQITDDDDDDTCICHRSNVKFVMDSAG
jgi:hypothetical protein